MPIEIRIELTDPTSPAAVELLAELDRYQNSLYPPTSVHLVPATSLKARGAVFFGAYCREALVGCGAYLNCGGYGEIKRMFVTPSVRGGGVGARILQALEEHARAAGLRVLRLETGVSQPEALRLYERSGYQRRGPFGSYRDDPLSLFMEKALG